MTMVVVMIVSTIGVIVRMVVVVIMAVVMIVVVALGHVRMPIARVETR